MGAFVGAMFAMGMSPAGIRERCHEELVVRGRSATTASRSLAGARRARARDARAHVRRDGDRGAAARFLLRELRSRQRRAGHPPQRPAGRGGRPRACACRESCAASAQAGSCWSTAGCSTACRSSRWPRRRRARSWRWTSGAGSTRRPRRGARIAARGRPRGRDPAAGAAAHVKETLARSIVLGSIESARASRQRADVRDRAGHGRRARCSTSRGSTRWSTPAARAARGLACLCNA